MRIKMTNARVGKVGKFISAAPDAPIDIEIDGIRADGGLVIEGPVSGSITDARVTDGEFVARGGTRLSVRDSSFESGAVFGGLPGTEVRNVNIAWREGTAATLTVGKLVVRLGTHAQRFSGSLRIARRR